MSTSSPIPLRLGLALALGAALTACVAEEPTATGDPATSTTDFKPPPPPDMAKPDDRAEPPLLDAVQNLTQYDTVPVHGTAEPGASVLIKSSDGSTVSADVMPSGRFCADIPLKKNTVNQFELRTIDALGNISDPVPLKVQQSGSPPVPSSTARPAENMAIGGTTSSTLSWNHGDSTSLRDGDRATYSGAWQRSFSTTDNVILRLAERRQIDTIRLRAPAECPLTAQFQVYASNADAPSDPKTTPMSWTLLRDVPSGAAGTEYEIKLSTPVVMSHVSLFFDRGWLAFGEADVNCGSSWTWGAYYSFTDLEAWSTPNAIPPPPSSAPSCGGG